MLEIILNLFMAESINMRADGIAVEPSLASTLSAWAIVKRDVNQTCDFVDEDNSFNNFFCIIISAAIPKLPVQNATLVNKYIDHPSNNDSSNRVALCSCIDQLSAGSINDCRHMKIIDITSLLQFVDKESTLSHAFTRLLRFPSIAFDCICAIAEISAKICSLDLTLTISFELIESIRLDDNDLANVNEILDIIFTT
jgi:hypothetical protein